MLGHSLYLVIVVVIPADVCLPPVFIQKSEGVGLGSCSTGQLQTYFPHSFWKIMFALDTDVGGAFHADRTKSTSLLKSTYLSENHFKIGALNGHHIHVVNEPHFHAREDFAALILAYC